MYIALRLYGRLEKHYVCVLHQSQLLALRVNLLTNFVPLSSWQDDVGYALASAGVVVVNHDTVKLKAGARAGWVREGRSRVTWRVGFIGLDRETSSHPLDKARHEVAQVGWVIPRYDAHTVSVSRLSFLLHSLSLPLSLEINIALFARPTERLRRTNGLVH